jgi:DNA polymerase III delta subunit
VRTVDERLAHPHAFLVAKRSTAPHMSYVLHGPNLLALDERVAQLRAELDPGGFSTTQLDVQATTVAEIAAAVQAAPFFGAGRLVILRNPVNPRKAAAAAEDDDAEQPGAGRVAWPEVADALRATAPGNHIIVRQDGTLASNHGAHKLAKELGWKIEAFRIPRGPELQAWVTDRAERIGLRLSADATTHLLDLLFPSNWGPETRYDTGAPDPQLLAIELEKLAAAGAGDMVDVALVDELVADRSGYKAFELSNAIFAGDAARSLRELERVLDAGQPAELMLSLLNGDIGVRLASQLGDGFSNEHVAGASGTTAGRIGVYRSKGPRLSDAAIQRSTEALRHVEKAVKTGAGGTTNDEIVPLVATLAVTARGGAGNRN